MKTGFPKRLLDVGILGGFFCLFAPLRAALEPGLRQFQLEREVRYLLSLPEAYAWLLRQRRKAPAVASSARER